VLESGVAGSIGKSSLGFLMTLHTDFHSGCANLCSHNSM
jgi:hypothetical protein